MKKNTLKKKTNYRPSEIPVNQAMLYGVRDELKADIRSLEAKMDSRFKSLDSRFESIDSRFESIDSRFKSIDSRFEKMISGIHRIGVLVEEQNVRNAVALDALIGLTHRQDRLEDEMVHHRKIISRLS